MKLDSLLAWGYVPCSICKKPLQPGDEIDFDHTHELRDGGGHDAHNIRPLHRACHKLKTAKATTQHARIDRLEKERLGLPKRARMKRKMLSRPFQRAKA